MHRVLLQTLMASHSKAEQSVFECPCGCGVEVVGARDHSLWVAFYSNGHPLLLELSSPSDVDQFLNETKKTLRPTAWAELRDFILNLWEPN